MPRIINKEYIEKNPEIIDDLKKGVFIYPTDTIYGLGCDATNEELVARIRSIKERPVVPFSVALPSLDLVEKNCVLSDNAHKHLKELPGHITIILPMKKLFVAKNVSPDGKSIGVRMFDSWFQEVVAKMGVPIITTSVNIARKPFMTCMENLDRNVRQQVDFIIEDGALNGRPSKLINLLNE